MKNKQDCDRQISAVGMEGKSEQGTARAKAQGWAAAGRFRGI